MAEDFEMDGSPPEGSENRTFVVAAAGLGGLIVLSLICLGLYALVLAPRQRQAAIEAPTQIALQNTLTAEALTATVLAEQATPTPEPTDTPTVPPTNTATPTQVIVLPTDTPTATTTPFTTLPTLAPGTVTAAVAQTQTAQAVAGGGATITPTLTPTATALPVTGFADEVGLPGMLLMAAGLLTIIFFSRRLRTAPATRRG
jgi:cytoskeletal protein RodZ